MNETRKDTLSRANTVPRTANEFKEWLCGDEACFLNAEVLVQAVKVHLSFGALRLNKNNPPALEAAQRLHDADMAKLEAMLGSPLSE